MPAVSSWCIACFEESQFLRVHPDEFDTIPSILSKALTIETSIYDYMSILCIVQSVPLPVVNIDPAQMIVDCVFMVQLA